jgi:hypothetical protein
MKVKINLKNGSDELNCSSIFVEDKYLKLTDCKIQDLCGDIVVTRYYRLVNVMSYDIVEEA